MNIDNCNDYRWTNLKIEEIPMAVSIGDQLFPTLQENVIYYLEKYSLFSEGCLALKNNNDLCGYIISHPWTLFKAPKLNSFIEYLPDTSNCMYIHDISILPEHRGKNLSRIGLEIIEELSLRNGFSYISITSVCGTNSMWESFGYKSTDHWKQKPDIDEYGSDAVYMIKRLNSDA
jgi:hypothetical protein